MCFVVCLNDGPYVFVKKIAPKEKYSPTDQEKAKGCIVYALQYFQ